MLTPEHKTVVLRSASQRLRGAGRASVLVCLLLCPALRAARGQTAAEEYQVKAAFLFHFAQLVDWPPGTFATASQPLALCMLNDEPQRAEIRRTIEGKLVGDRTLHVRFLSEPRDSAGCDILFLSSYEARRQAALLQQVHGAPVLTVGETDSFLAEGGMIRFRLERDRIRFDVDLGPAESARLRISSRLLLLATSVTHGEGGSGR